MEIFADDFPSPASGEGEGEGNLIDATLTSILSPSSWRERELVNRSALYFSEGIGEKQKVGQKHVLAKPLPCDKDGGLD